MDKDALDAKLVEAFGGKVVRKDLLQQIKAGSNIPTFVLEFLLARYCASDDETEIQEGLKAVLASIQENYVHPDEANAAQSRVTTKGRYRFIDKVHVKFVEREKRHWAELENFNSQRVAIPDKLYKDNERLLEGGIWAEVVVCPNDVDEDDYAFYIESLRPIQVSNIDFDAFARGREKFTTDEWMRVVLRSVGLEPDALTRRQCFHYLMRLASLVEANYNFIELGPRGTGKSYFYSEFSPYATLLSGGQASKAVLFYNNSRKKPGLVCFWDTIGFDEVAKVQIKDAEAIQIMKDYMANGRFSRGVNVIGSASLAFVGNIDYSIPQIVASPKHDLFLSLPPELDFAVMDRFACYLPGWEIPKTDRSCLTSHFGFITDYLAEVFHHQFKHVNRFEEVKRRVKFGPEVKGRDESTVTKTICALLKLLHPGRTPSDEEFEECVEYALEYRRRVKEQMNKRKPDEEFALINLSYFKADGTKVVVWCPESKDSPATQHPSRSGGLPGGPVFAEPENVAVPAPDAPAAESAAIAAPPAASEPPVDGKGGEVPPAPEPVEASSAAENEPREELVEKHFKILYGDTGHSYESIFGPYLVGAKKVVVEDPYIRTQHQVQNFVRFCETVVKAGTVRDIELVTGYDGAAPSTETEDKFEQIEQSLLEADIGLTVRYNQAMHDREIRLDNGWTVKIGRGLDFYQRPANWFCLGATDISLRPCLETSVDIFRSKNA